MKPRFASIADRKAWLARRGRFMLAADLFVIVTLADMAWRML